MSDSKKNSLSTNKVLKNEQSEEQKQEELAPLSLWEVLSSTIFAAFGIQKSENKKRDFTRGKPGQFIFAGILFTTIFVLLVVLVVNTVLSSVQSG